MNVLKCYGAVLSLTLILSACGDDDDNTGASVDDNTGGTAETGEVFVSGLDGAIALSEVTDAQLVALCGVYDNDPIVKESVCIRRALIRGSEHVDLCAEELAECRAAAGDLNSTCGFKVIDAETCSATIGELEACLGEHLTIWKEQNELFTCSAGLLTRNVEPGPSCTAFAEKCPEFL